MISQVSGQQSKVPKILKKVCKFNLVLDAIQARESIERKWNMVIKLCPSLIKSLKFAAHPNSLNFMNFLNISHKSSALSHLTSKVNTFPPD